MQSPGELDKSDIWRFDVFLRLRTDEKPIREAVRNCIAGVADDTSHAIRLPAEHPGDFKRENSSLNVSSGIIFFQTPCELCSDTAFNHA